MKGKAWKDGKCPKYAVYALLWAIPMLQTGCTGGSNGSFCAVYEPVYPDYERDTPETIRQIDRNNIVYSECP